MLLLKHGYNTMKIKEKLYKELIRFLVQ